MGKDEHGSSSSVAATTKEELVKVITKLQDEVHALKKRGTGAGPSVISPKPTTFSGERGDVRTFLTQVRAYLLVNRESFAYARDEVLFAAGLLTGRAGEWFQPTMEEYLTKSPADYRTETTRMFQNFNNFKEALINTFGNPDEIRQAERQMRGLRQKGSAGAYTADFKRISAKLDWGDSAFMVQYYQGLRDDVKDELSKGPRPDTLIEYMNQAILVDNRLYERRLEKGGAKYQRPVGRHQPNTSKPRSTAYGHHSGPMELDAATREGKKCYSCGKIGHFSRQCPTKKKGGRPWKPVPTKQANVMERSPLLPQPHLNQSLAALGYYQDSDGDDADPEDEDMEGAPHSLGTPPESSTTDIEARATRGLPRIADMSDTTDEEDVVSLQEIQVKGQDARDNRSLVGIILDGDDQIQTKELIGNAIHQPHHPEHNKLIWVACPYHTCPYHLDEKLKYRWFPDLQPVTLETRRFHILRATQRLPESDLIFFEVEERETKRVRLVTEPGRGEPGTMVLRHSTPGPSREHTPVAPPVGHDNSDSDAPMVVTKRGRIRRSHRRGDPEPSDESTNENANRPSDPHGAEWANAIWDTDALAKQAQPRPTLKRDLRRLGGSKESRKQHSGKGKGRK